MFWVAVFISCKPFLPPPPSPPPPPLLFIQLVSILLWCLFLDNHEIPTEVSTEDIDYMPMPPESSLFIFSTTNMWVEEFCCNKSPDIRHFGSEKGTRTESVPQLFLANFAQISRVPLSYWQFFTCPRSHCEIQLGQSPPRFKGGEYWPGPKGPRETGNFGS